MKGKLIVIEGVDSSGKETQTKQLSEKLRELGYRVKMISFPDYESDSSALVKMYLNGDFGTDPNAVSPFAASLFYAADRYASYATKWKKDYEEGSIIICDRYVTSNMIHQAAKIEDGKEKSAFLDWLCDLEYNKLSLPQPCRVFFLDMPPKMSAQLMAERTNKITGEAKKDIHESDFVFLEKSYHNAKYVSEKYAFTEVRCDHNGALRSIEDIGDEILKSVCSLLKSGE